MILSASVPADRGCSTFLLSISLRGKKGPREAGLSEPLGSLPPGIAAEKPGKENSHHLLWKEGNCSLIGHVEVNLCADS